MEHKQILTSYCNQSITIIENDNLIGIKVFNNENEDMVFFN